MYSKQVSIAITVLLLQIYSLMGQVSLISLSSWNKSSSIYDQLSKRSYGCDFRISKHIVFFCSDGYVSISPLQYFIQSKTKFKADRIFEYTDVKEVNFLDQVSIVRSKGLTTIEFYNDTQKVKSTNYYYFPQITGNYSYDSNPYSNSSNPASSMNNSTDEEDEEDEDYDKLEDKSSELTGSSSDYSVVNGFLYNDYLFLQILDSIPAQYYGQMNDTLVSRSTTNKYLAIRRNSDKMLVTSLQATIQSFAVSKNQGNYFTIFAVQNQPMQQTRLIIKEFDYNFKPQQNDFIDIDNCGSQLKVTQRLILVGCPNNTDSQEKISIIDRDSQKLIEELSQQGNFTNNMQVMESEDGNHVMIISTVLNNLNQKNNQSIVIVEIILNENLGENPIYLKTHLFSTQQYRNSKNAGQIKYAASYPYLLYFFDKFDTIFGMTLCDMTSYYDPTSQSCKSCDDDAYSVSFQSQECIPCNSDVNSLSEQENEKFRYICKNYKQTTKPFPLALIIGCACGVFVLFVIILTIVLVIVKRKRKTPTNRPTPYSINPQDSLQADSSAIQVQVDNQGRYHRRREIQQETIRIMQQIDIKFPLKFFGSIQNRHKVNSCSICFEEFRLDTPIRETPCFHIFHSECLTEWIRIKLQEQPDCPFCRKVFEI